MKSLILSITLMVFMSCNSLNLVEASMNTMAASRPGLKSKVAYKFNVKVNNIVTINKVTIGGYDVSKQVAIYSLPSGEIIPLGKSIEKGSYNLGVKLNKKEAKELDNKAIISFTSSGKKKELEIVNITKTKNILTK